jgi:multidrug efflux system membrane fusion protein
MLEALPNAVVIPASAVQEGPRGPYVYVVTSDHTAELRPVTIGQRLAGRAVVSAGLRGEEEVIVEGQFRVEPGAVVNVVAAPVPDATAAR